jgi:hypothetical protein
MPAEAVPFPAERLTPMEAEILGVLAETHAEAGFPRPEQINVSGRENTGNGRYTDIWFEKAIDLVGPVEAPVVIKLPQVRYGMAAIVFLRESRLSSLEIVVYGDDFWNGDETGYSLSRY